MGGAFLVHGLRVAAEGDAADLTRALLAGFQPAPAGPADLVVALDRSRAPAPAPPGARPLFFHGPVRAGERARAVELGDGASLLVVAPGGGRIDGRVHAASLADGGHAFTHVTLFLALVVALRHRNLFHLHAAALVAPGGARLLVPGTAGAGKTTLTLALVQHGCAYLGDDAVLVMAGARGPAVLAFPRPFHVAERSARAFPAAAPHLGAPAAGRKRPVDPERAFPGRARLAMEAPDVLLFPGIVTAPRTSLAPCTGADALGALVEAGALVVVDAMPRVPEQLAVLRGIANGAQGLRVRLGQDLLDDPAGTAASILAYCAV